MRRASRMWWSETLFWSSFSKGFVKKAAAVR